jgi:3-dehydroquinate synthase
MEQISIRTNSKTYPVYLGTGATQQIEAFLHQSFPTLTKVLIITDETVGKLYLKKLEDLLESFSVVHFVVPSGEHAKTFDVYHQCLTFALEQKLDRKSMVLALGGGAVGDLSGFVAATFMRGIPFIQIPTTILAHDSAVGGKVAINHPLGKNMIGAFYQPEAVFYDLDFLLSLPPKERRSGFAEVIKHGLIQDRDFYEWLTTNINNLQQLTEKQLSYFLKKGINIKGTIVSADEKETGVRAFLNFGHTLGHAIEGEAGYGNITHGEAVAIGMLFSLRLSMMKLGLHFDLQAFQTWLKRIGYETKLPAGLELKRLIKRMEQDKKSIGGRVQFVLLDEVGSPRIDEMAYPILLQELELFRKEGE